MGKKAAISSAAIVLPIRSRGSFSSLRNRTHDFLTSIRFPFSHMHYQNLCTLYQTGIVLINNQLYGFYVMPEWRIAEGVYCFCQDKHAGVLERCSSPSSPARPYLPKGFSKRPRMRRRSAGPDPRSVLSDVLHRLWQWTSATIFKALRGFKFSIVYLASNIRC